MVADGGTPVLISICGPVKMRITCSRNYRWMTLVCVALIVHIASPLLLFPVNTVLQISLGVSWPIEVPDRKVFMNAAFQFNYNTPNRSSNFYTFSHFPYGRALDSIIPGDDDESPLLRGAASPTVRGNVTKASSMPTAASASDTDGPMEVTSNGRRRRPRSAECHQANVASDETEMAGDSLVAALGSDGKLFDVDKYYGDDRNACHGKRDMGAGELYRTLEQTLTESGLDPNCLLKSVCQLARHPLDLPEGEEDLLVEMLHFVLTPSVHDSFHDHESVEKERYEAAENAGKRGADCDLLYPECGTSLLDYMTSLEEDAIDTNYINT